MGDGIVIFKYFSIQKDCYLSFSHITANNFQKFLKSELKEMSNSGNQLGILPFPEITIGSSPRLW